MNHGVDTSFLVATELASHTRHAAGRALLQRLGEAGDNLALAPQVLTEFVHVVTDPRRCSSPPDMATALERAELIWNATQVVQVFPDASATSQFLTWMRQHRLGRKRLLDTLLAATYWSAGIRSVVTLNRSDFDTFGCFTFVDV
jgi:predicted nucleic acid-binding protein